MRAWLGEYCDEHAQDDPDATHVQIRRLSAWSWLTGGKLVGRQQFLVVVVLALVVCGACAGGVEAGRQGLDRRLGRDALEGAEPLPRARPPVGRQPGRPGAVERQPLDDGVACLARLARADAGAVRADRDGARAARRVGEGRGARRARPAGRARLSRLAAAVAAEDGLRRDRLEHGRRRAHRVRAPRRRPDAHAELRHAAARDG